MMLNKFVWVPEPTFDIHCVLFETARARPPVADSALVQFMYGH